MSALTFSGERESDMNETWGREASESGTKSICSQDNQTIEYFGSIRSVVFFLCQKNGNDRLPMKGL